MFESHVKNNTDFPYNSKMVVISMLNSELTTPLQLFGVQRYFDVELMVFPKLTLFQQHLNV